MRTPKNTCSATWRAGGKQHRCTRQASPSTGLCTGHAQQRQRGVRLSALRPLRRLHGKKLVPLYLRVEPEVYAALKARVALELKKGRRTSVYQEGSAVMRESLLPPSEG